MLPAVLRLNKTDIKFLKQSNRKFQNDLFGVLVNPGSSLTSKFGVVVSTKLSKLAVERNSIRRKFYEAVAPLVSKIEGNYYFLFLVRRLAKDVPVEQIRQRIEILFKEEKFIL